MQSLPLAAKLFSGAIVATVIVSIFSALAVAQVYQIRPDGTLMYAPRYINPNVQQRTTVPQIYPGQIINGERVVRPAATSPLLSRGEAVNPPLPPVSNSNRAEPKPQQSQPSEKAPKKNLPIPAGPALQSEPTTEGEPEATDAVSNMTPVTSKSSVATEEKNDPPQQKMPAAAPPTLELPAEEPDSQTELPETASSSALSFDKLSPVEAPLDELPTIEPPSLETTEQAPEEPQDELSLDPPALDEEIIAEIKQLRDQFGGGISETLKDIDQMPSFGEIEITSAQDQDPTATDKEISPEQLFNEELRSVMSEQQSNGGSAIQTPETPLAVSSQRQPQPINTDRAEELRTCARELEQLAGRLETIKAYEHADQVRRQAAELWTTARQQ